jgi:hypothetical protein
MREQDSAVKAEQRQRGYMALRLGTEREVAEAMGLQEGEYESFAPGPSTWTEVEDFECPGFTLPEPPEPEWITGAEAQAEAIAFGKWIRELAAEAKTREDLYELSMKVMKFDHMLEEINPHIHSPVDPVWDHVSRALDRAEERILNDRHRTEKAAAAAARKARRSRSRGQVTELVARLIRENGEVDEVVLRGADFVVRMLPNNLDRDPSLTREDKAWMFSHLPVVEVDRGRRALTWTVQ